jgi:hypothetical protein
VAGIVGEIPGDHGNHLSQPLEETFLFARAFKGQDIINARLISKSSVLEQAGETMKPRRSGKRWGWFLLFPVLTLGGALCWLGISFAAGLLFGPGGLNDPCRGEEPTLLAPAYPVADLAADGRSLYWLAAGDPGTLVKMSLGSGKSQVLAQLELEPYSLLVDDNSVFWVEGRWEPTPEFRLEKVDKQGGGATELRRSQGSMFQLGMDGEYLYWLDYEADTVYRLPKAGGEAEVVYSAPEGLNALSIVNGRVYLGSGEWLGRLGQQGLETLVTADRLLQDLGIGLRDEWSRYRLGSVIEEADGRIIFTFSVDNYPGMISCSDNATHIVSLPEGGGAPVVLASAAGGMDDFALAAPNLYLTGNCLGGQVVNLDTGENSTLPIEYSTYNLAVDEGHLYWANDEGVKCMARGDK